MTGGASYNLPDRLSDSPVNNMTGGWGKKMNKSKKYEPVPIRNFKIIPI